MSRVDIVVNGRNYAVQCEDGQETHLQKLARYVDHKIGMLTSTLGQVGEARLLLLAALTISDELHEASLARAKAEQSAVEKDQAELAAIVDRLAERVEAIAVKLEDN